MQVDPRSTPRLAKIVMSRNDQWPAKVKRVPGVSGVGFMWTKVFDWVVEIVHDGDSRMLVLTYVTVVCAEIFDLYDKCVYAM